MTNLWQALFLVAAMQLLPPARVGQGCAGTDCQRPLPLGATQHALKHAHMHWSTHARTQTCRCATHAGRLEPLAAFGMRFSAVQVLGEAVRCRHAPPGIARLKFAFRLSLLHLHYCGRAHWHAGSGRAALYAAHLLVLPLHCVSPLPIYEWVRRRPVA